MKPSDSQSVYMADVGVIYLKDRLFVGAFGEMTVPDEALCRGHRLAQRGFCESVYQYAARWCAYQLEKQYLREVGAK